MLSIDSNYHFIGELYCRLIEGSPSRQMALEKVQEFEQLLVGTCGKEIEDVHNFDSDHVDRIVSLIYNYGVTLVDLDQAYENELCDVLF